MALVDPDALVLKTGTQFKFRTPIFSDEAQTLPFNLTGWTFACEARDQKSKDGELLVTFAGALVGPATDGIIEWTVGKTITGALTVSPMFFDVEINETAVPENTQRPVQGQIVLDLEVTD